MTKQIPWVVWMAAVLGLLTVGNSVGAARAGEGPPDPGRFATQLAAGEFAPALETARQVPTLQQRDTLLAQVAGAQAAAGARDAALSTAAEISSDQVRTDALAAITAEPLGGRGGAAMADFESLINLITSTVHPTSWEDVGGPGSIKEFPTGVHVEPTGLLRPLLQEEKDGQLASLRAASAPKASPENARRNSALRMVSLTRLEKAIQLRQAAGRRPTEAMRYLAGLQRIQYVFVYPESGDVVLAGPAGDWTYGPEGRIVGAESGRPVVRLDDLVVVFRHMLQRSDARFGCMINPRQENLAQLQEFLQKSARGSISSDSRPAWLAKVRTLLGAQDIEVYGGLDPRTRAARVMVEADYRMKLVGAGLEEAVPGVVPYLQLIKVAPGQAPPPMGVLRWWFTLNYEALRAARDHQAFAIRGQGVKVESENERLTAEGKRIHTGSSDELNRQWAQSFTSHFESLAAKYPVYAELRNLFDLALVAALIRAEDMPNRLGWHLKCFGDPQAFPVELGPAPKEVQTVLNHRIVNRVNILVFISGGVSVNPASLVTRQAIQPDRDGRLDYHHSHALPSQSLATNAWWWD